MVDFIVIAEPWLTILKIIVAVALLLLVVAYVMTPKKK